MKNSTTNYKRFDRHEIFNMDDTSLVLDCISRVDKWDYDNGGADLSNMLYGLFDGYYYNKIHYYITEHLPDDLLEKIQELLKKIDKV